jgi:hypothetical protein
LPAILLSEPAQQLIQDIAGRDDLFHGLPHIRKRIVSWGVGAAPVELDHAAIVVSEETLLGRLGSAAEASSGFDPEWTVCAAQLPASVTHHRFGSRTACAMSVELGDKAEAAACWIESLEDGWLFLIASDAQSGWLLAAGQNPETLLEGSRVIRERVAWVGAATSAIPVSPQLIDPLGGANWIACGGAAMTFDPLCGDGTAHAIREAILAAAVIGAAARGGDVASLVSHYDARLTSAFQRHLVHCLKYYRTGGSGPWWNQEAESLIKGIEWCNLRTGGPPQFRYRLQGLELQPIG